MKSKLSKNQWVAVSVSLAVAVLIVFFSFQSSPYIQDLKTSSEQISVSNTEDKKNNMMDNNYDNLSELIIEETTEGDGKLAEAGKTVSVNYEGFLTDGTKFDSSLDRGVPFEFILGSGAVIEGWDKGVLGMKEKGVRKLIIPAHMAYGESGVGPIPPNAVLIFTVELLEVKN